LRVAKDLIGVGAVIRIGGAAGVGRYSQFPATGINRFRQQRESVVAEHGDDIVHRADGSQDDREPIARDAADQEWFEAFAESPRDRLQQGIRYGFAERCVDRSELLESKTISATRSPRRAAVCNFETEVLAGKGPVGKFGERVVRCEVCDPPALRREFERKPNVVRQGTDEADLLFAEEPGFGRAEREATDEPSR